MPTPPPQNRIPRKLGQLLQLSSSERVLLALKKARLQIEAMKRRESEPIAIIGMGCRFPGADNPEAFWQLLRDGRDMVREIPADRWDTRAYYDSDPEKRGKIYIQHGAFLDQVDQFDPLFFGISPREATSLDPQQRLLLEVSWEALEHAGQAQSGLVGSQTGVFVGIGQNDYGQLQLNAGDPERIDVYDGTGNLFCFASGRLSYTLGLQGPNMALDTACSSSLVAIHLACQSLRLGECKLALAGGVHLILEPTVTVFLSRTQALAPDGRCKTFDAAANGYGRGEGCGMLVLKRLSDALADGDNILALIRGSAINHDGPSSGLTVPNKLAQEALIRRALANANLEPHQIDYIEAHGTGTSLGDPIEVRALAGVLGTRESPLMLGAVKTNIGHLEPAAGVAGVIKVVQSMQHHEIPPHLHFKTPNPNLNWEHLPVTIPTEVTPWTGGGGFAGISSFGMSGTNAHIILEKAPARLAPHSPLFPSDSHASYDGHLEEKEGGRGRLESQKSLLTLSAKTKESLMALMARYSEYFATHPNAQWADICFTANIGRSHFKHRLSIVAGSLSEAKEKLETLKKVVTSEERLSKRTPTRQKIAFLFTGQGSQYVGMGQQLYESNPTFRQTLDRCDEILRPYLDQPLLSILYPNPVLTEQGKEESSNHNTQHAIDNTAYTQPALFALEYALAQVWLSWGIRPDVVMGHSVGEYVAACVAGVLSLEDGLKLIAERGRLMQALPASPPPPSPPQSFGKLRTSYWGGNGERGEMVAVWASEAEVAPLITSYSRELAIAAINGPESVVLSGSHQAVQAMVELLTQQGIKTKSLQVSHAFHSPLMEPMLTPFMRVAQEVNYSTPRLKMISNVTGQLATATVANAEYWVDHVHLPVRFADGMESLSDMGINTFIEIGPKPILLGMARQMQGGEGASGRASASGRGGEGARGRAPEPHSLWLPSLRPGRGDWEQMLESLGQLYEHGAKVEWRGFYRHDGNVRQRVHLPTYPWQRERYWLDLPKGDKPTKRRRANLADASGLQIHPLLHERLQLPVKQVIFSSYLGKNTPAYLADHRVFGQVIFPAAAYLEIALAAGTQGLKGQVLLEDVLIQQAMILPEEGEEITVKLVLTPHNDNSEASFELYTLALTNTLDPPDERWIAHASGKIRREETQARQLSNVARFDPSPLLSLPPLLPEAYYQGLREVQGFDYGSTFQVIESFWVEGNQALAQVCLPEGLTLHNYHFHPVLLDAGLQLLCAIVPQDGQTYLPVGLESLQLYRQPERELWIQAEVDLGSATYATGMPSESLTAELDFFDDEGLIAQIRGLSLRATSLTALKQPSPLELGGTEGGLGAELENFSHMIYQITWHAQEYNQKAREQNGETSPTRPLTPSPPLSLTGDWLIFADREGIGEELARLLAEQDAYSHLVYRGSSYQRLGVDKFQLNPAEPFDFIQFFMENKQTWRGIIYLWNLDIKKGTPLAGCDALLHLVQALNNEVAESLAEPATFGTPPLWLVTRGSQAVSDSEQLVDPWQAPLWGLGKVIGLEHPELKPVCLDLAPPPPNIGEGLEAGLGAAQILFDELSSPASSSLGTSLESQIAYREGIRYVARLERHEGAATGNGKSYNEANGDFTVKLGRYGLLDELYLAPLSRQELGAREVEIEVRATGLNFRDVLRALGMLQEVEGAIGIYSVEDAWFGLECAGVISRVGTEVSGLHVGDEVIAALAKGSLGSFVTVEADFVLPKPKGLTDEEGATIPIAFLTAYYGLYELANLQAGERVLIHSAAGGVGQAAVQLAQLAGAEVFATASPSKWAFLQSMGVEHIMNSRTLAFADEVMALTSGQGVDVVLNSLNGDFIDKSFEALGNGGRFIELGKIGIWDEAQVQHRRPDVEYVVFDLGDVAQENPSLIASMLGKLKPMFTQRARGEESERLKPLPLKSFPMRNVVDAFRYIAQAKHIGKVVTTFAPVGASIRSDGSYLITGGLGALGLELADWLVEQGARYIVLTGRSKPKEAAESRLEALREATGATVMVMSADVSNREQMSALLREIEIEIEIKQTLPPLRGIIHAAGVLDDGILLEQDKERFEKVMAPKVQGSWNLHLLTQEQALDFFVLFSSAAAFVGSAGQANYAAANSFMDTLAHYRRRQGLPALSINWGPWAQAGMATSEQVTRRLAAQGWQPMNPYVGLKLFGQLLTGAAAQLGVLPINWAQFLAQRDPSPLYETFKESQSLEASASSTDGKPEFMTQLASAPLGERRELLGTYVRTAIGRVLGIHNSAQIEERQRLFDLGLDSLTAVELRRRLEAGLEYTLRSTLLFHYPTVEALVDYLAEEVLSEFFSDALDSSLTIGREESAQVYSATEMSDAIADDEEVDFDDITQLLAANLGIDVE